MSRGDYLQVSCARRVMIILSSILLAVTCGWPGTAGAGTPNAQLDAVLPNALNRAYQQMGINPSSYPIYTNSAGNWVTDTAAYWSSGFWPGELWLAYGLSGTGSWMTKAQTWTNGVQSQQTDTTSHDVGNKIFPPYMNGYRLTGTSGYLAVTLTAAGSMASRYNATVGCIKSFEASGSHSGQFPVEIDNMSTLEMLFWAARNGGQTAWRDTAISHALRTRTEFLHPTNNGTYHVVWFDPTTGAVLYRGTLQGYSDSSTWSRGQAWGIYGFAMCCRETGDYRFLTMAQMLVDYYLSRLPADQVPPWDFDTGQTSPPRDTSSAAIVASALFDLSRLTADSTASQRYWDAACNILISLCSSTYLSNGSNSQGILLHGTGHYPAASAVDASLIWGDYYFLQAIERYKYLCRSVSGSHTSATTWQNWPIQLERGQFRVEFDVTPNGSAIDGVIGLSAGPAKAYSLFGALVRFNNTGYIDVRNSETYQADSPLSYTAGRSYHFAVDVDVETRHYTVYVTPSGGSEIRLANNYAFRMEQAGAMYLDNWGIICETGTCTASNVQLQCRVHDPTRGTAYVTVQEAIDAALDGDEIVLDPATYTGHGNRDIDFRGKAITVRSTDPGDPEAVRATIIDCQGSETAPHRGFALRTGEDRSAILSGLTIINGYAPTETISDSSSVAGGAIYCQGTSPTIRCCQIRANTAQGQDLQPAYGGGIFSQGGSPLIEDCVIAQNVASGLVVNELPVNPGEAYGGGICCLGGDPVIQRCTIDGNSAVGGNTAAESKDGFGGGVHCDGAARIQDCTVSNNLATGDTLRHVLLGRGYGGGVHCAGQTTILDCSIAGNQALNNWSYYGSLGGGIHCSGTTLIRGCDITHNDSDWGDSWGDSSWRGGGGIYCEGAVTVDDCLIAGNRTHELGGGIHGLDASALTVSNCTIVGNEADAYETGGPSGGGVLCGSGTIRNCLIAENYGIYGGGLASPYGGSTAAVGCTIADNQGSGVYAGTGIVCSNCIIWGNMSMTGDQIVSSVVPMYSCIENWTGGGTGNISSNPMFLDPYGPDGSSATWEDNNYHLLKSSPCINAADPAYAPAPGETDIDGQPRVLYGRMDMGADESFSASMNATCDWLPCPGLPGTNGPVLATVNWDPDGAGPQPALLVAGGDFSMAGNTFAYHIAIWNGRQWQAPQGGTNGSVCALTVWNGQLIAAGSFTTSGDITCNRVACWDGSRWQPLGSGMNDTVKALIVWNGQLIAGGVFTVAGGVSCSCIARWDGVSWQPLGTGITSPVYTPEVRTLAVYNGELVAGGVFTMAGAPASSLSPGDDQQAPAVTPPSEQAYLNIARWNGEQWRVLAGSLAGTVDASSVDALIVYDNLLIAGGYFNYAGGTSCSSIAAWNGSTWQRLGTEYYWQVSALSVWSGQLVAGIPDDDICSWDGSTWHTLPDTVMGPGLQGGGTTYTLSVYNGQLIAGGAFSEDNYILRLNGPQWQRLGTGIDGTIEALASYNGQLIAGGSFVSADNVTSWGIAGWDGNAWHGMGSGMGGNASWVYALAVWNSQLVAGGEFTTAGNVACSCIARWDGTQWQSMGTGMSGTWPKVNVLVVWNGQLIAGGEFTSAGGVACNHIARWDGSTWQSLGTGINGNVKALTVYNGLLIAGGTFTSAGGTTCNNIACWNGTTWQSLGTGLTGGYGDGPIVLTLAVYGSNLIAGGNFETAGGTACKFIARWDGQHWNPLDDGVAGSRSMGPNVNALTVWNGQLIAGGYFTEAGQVLCNYIACWDGNTWASLDTGMSGASPHVDALTVWGNQLIAGGDFTTAGSTISGHWARWGLVGNVNYDKYVNVGDLQVVVASWGSSAGGANWNFNADFNGDGYINVGDLQILVAHWGKSLN